jgi:hypothetical protein
LRLPEVTTLSGLPASAFAMPAPTGYRFALAVFVAIFRSLAGRIRTRQHSWDLRSSQL